VAQDDVNPADRPQDRPAQQPAADELALRRRVSDFEREQVADVLREAAGEGRLSYTELEDRLETLYSAKTYGELVEIASDLPNGPTAPSAAVAPAGPQYQPSPSGSAPVIKVFLSDTKRTGNWVPPQRQEVNAVLGDVTLDYTEAQIQYQEIFLDVKAILADVKIRVPQNAVVHLDGNPVLGSVKEEESGIGGSLTNQTPTPVTIFHIRATAILGDIKIKRGPRLLKRLGLT
jgi:hypothetical protein